MLTLMLRCNRCGRVFRDVRPAYYSSGACACGGFVMAMPVMSVPNVWPVFDHPGPTEYRCNACKKEGEW